MREEKNMACDAEGGSCGSHHHGCCGYKSLVRWLIALVVGIIVFCIGVKVGEMKVLYGGWGYGVGYPSMMNYGNYGNYGYGMMRGWQGVVSPAATTSSSVEAK